MSSQAGAVTAREFPTTIPINHENRRVVDSLKEKVARRAYELFERGGRAEGNDMRHWLQAESEILSKIPEIRETSSSYTVNIPVQGFKPEEIYVGVDANRTLVLAENKSPRTDTKRRMAASAESRFFSPRIGRRRSIRRPQVRKSKMAT